MIAQCYVDEEKMLDCRGGSFEVSLMATSEDNVGMILIEFELVLVGLT